MSYVNVGPFNKYHPLPHLCSGQQSLQVFSIRKPHALQTRESVPTAVRWMGVGIVLQLAVRSRATCVPTRESVLIDPRDP